jgi:hypothetical protein
MITIRSTPGLAVIELNKSNTVEALKKAYLEKHKYLIQSAVQVYSLNRTLQEDSHYLEHSNYLIFIRPIQCHHH